MIMNIKISTLTLLLLSLMPASINVVANDTSVVDLSDKQGVVDPKDLKKHNPKEKSLKAKEPPVPETKPEPDVPLFEVNRGGIDDANRGINDSNSE